MDDLIYQNHVVTITYNHELQLGKATWNGFLSSSEFREAIEACLNMMEKYKPLRWLGDNRKLRAIRQSDQDWFVESVFPRLVGTSLRLNASIVSEDLFNKMAVEQIVKRVGNLGDMVLKEFDNEAEALDWLTQPIAVPDQA